MISSITDQLDLSTLSLPASGTAEDEGKLGQEEFLQLMITQLENQDPFKPLESGEFLGQLAQFGTVTGLSQLQTSFEGLASSLVSNQALQAAGLVGRSVLVRGDQALLETGGMVDGAIDLGTSTNALRVQILDSAGQLVRQLDLGAQPAGFVRFGWDGVDDAGVVAAPGRYTVTAQYLNGNETQSAATLVNAAVDSVTIGSQGLAVQLRGLGEVPFSAVQEIG